MHFLYALVRKSSFSKAQGFVKPAPEQLVVHRLRFHPVGAHHEFHQCSGALRHASWRPDGAYPLRGRRRWTTDVRPSSRWPRGRVGDGWRSEAHAQVWRPLSRRVDTGNVWRHGQDHLENGRLPCPLACGACVIIHKIMYVYNYYDNCVVQSITHCIQGWSEDGGRSLSLC